MTDTAAPARSVVREDLCRSGPFTLTRAEPDTNGDGLTIEGYGAVFDTPTQIDSWEGTFEETIAPGAFRKSLRERTPKMQYDHGRHPLLGSLPLGRWNTAEEDARGMHLAGRLTDNWLVQPFRDAIRDGGVDGMSFRFTVIREDWADKNGVPITDEEELLGIMFFNEDDRGPVRRTLRELSVSEAGPVAWPAYDATSVGVRSSGTPAARPATGQVVIDLARIDAPETRQQLARAVWAADAAARALPEDDKPARDPAQGPDHERPEPRSTEHPADVHPPSSGAPHTTGRSAGEHSSARPANPTERRALMREQYRAVSDRVLAINADETTEREAR